jgi:hypothetical protein
LGCWDYGLCCGGCVCACCFVCAAAWGGGIVGRVGGVGGL